MLLPETFLHRVVHTILGETFDCLDLGSIGLNCEQRTALRRLPVDSDDTRTTLAGVAPNMCSGQAKMIPEKVHQQGSRFHLSGSLLAINRHPNLDLLGGFGISQVVAPS